MKCLLVALLVATFTLKLAPAQDDKTISLSFPADQNLNLEALVEFVRKNLELPLAYDRNLFRGDNSNLTIKPAGTNKVSRSELLSLLNNTLRIRGLALVPDRTNPNSYYTIKPIPEVRPLVPRGKADNFKSGDIFTEIFTISGDTTTEAKAYIESFYPSGNNKISPVFITELAKRRELIVTGFKQDMLLIEEIVKRFNSGDSNITRAFYDAKHIDLEELASLLASIIGSQVDGAKPDSNQNNKAGSRSDLKIVKQASRNRLLLIGTLQQIAEAKNALEELDTETELVFETYKSNQLSATRIDELFREFLSQATQDREFKSTVDASRNLLIVQATARVHRQLRQLVEKLSRDNSENPESGQARLLQTYTLKNVKAQDILDTIRAVERTTFGSRFRQESGQRSLNFRNPSLNQVPPLANPDQIINGGFRQPFGLNFRLQDNQFGAGGGLLENQQPQGRGQNQPQDVQQQDSSQSIIPGEAKVESYGNKIIVVAEPEVQALYAKLINELDKRPPQVLIEATVVSIDYSDDYALGIEISSGDRIGARRILSFTSFGLSNVDATTGALSLIPGVGFNGTLVDPDSADAVLRALANHRRARVVSAPRILVNDNSEGELSSIAEVPFTSVNASNTVSTTSFAGFAEAGTSIRVLPNISDGNHVNLDFNVTVNDFAGSGVDGIPPPRQTDDVTSQVTIPDGHTVIVGGLRRRRQSRDESYLPGLEHLSIFRLLAGSQSRNSGDELLFIFLKPVILRDDKFRDLRFLSEQERQRAQIPDDLPQSRPVLIR